MRHIFILILAIISSGANAQSFSTGKATGKPHTQVLSGLLGGGRIDIGSAAAKTTAGTPTQRVIAQSTKDNATSTYTDSVTCTYTGMHRSFFDYNTIIYPYNYTYGTTPMFDLAGIFTEPQVKYDTYVHWTINPFTMPAFTLYEGNFAKYDTNNNQISFTKLFVDSTTNDNVSYANTFDTADNITKGLTFNLNAGVKDSAFKQFFKYNASNKLVMDSVYELHLGVWRIVARTYYTYNTPGYLTQIDHFANETDTSFLLPLVQQSKYANTYDASGRLLTVLTSLYDGTSLVNYIKDTFEYTGTATFHSSWRQHQFEPINGTWWPQYKMSKHINTLGKPDTVYHQSWDSIANAWVPISKDVITYNPYDNPAKVFNYEYNWTSYSTTPDYTTTYYYDVFLLEEESSVQDIVKGESVNVFPNPARETLVISELTGQKTITVADLTGRIVLRQSANQNGNSILSLQEFTPGTYVVTINDDNGKTLQRAKFIKE